MQMPDGHNSTSAETPSHITSSSAHGLEWCCWRRWTEWAESLSLTSADAARPRERHVSTSASSYEATERKASSLCRQSEAAPPVTSETRQTVHDNSFQGMDLDADCCYFGWRLCNFTLNHSLLQTAPPCDTLRTDTGFLLTDFSATAV